MKKNWLSNSTYKSSVEYYNETEEIPNNEFMQSDSNSSDNEYLKTKKKYRQKRIKASQIRKYFLNELPSISEESSKYRSYNFLENMPKQDRSNNAFIDLKGNSQISRYGCIYDKHIPKYRSKFDSKSMKEKLSDRYYIKLNQMKGEKIIPIIKRGLCDSHCICQQPFIPIPFDITDNNPNSTATTTMNQEESIILTTTAILNETINRDPHNIDAWIRLINHQSPQSVVMISGTINNSTITDRKLTIVEKALSRNQNNIQLHLLRLMFGGELWQPDRLQKEWAHLIFNHSTDIDLWRFYIAQINRQSIGFAVDKIINLYTKCFGIFFNIMSGRTRTKSIEPDTVYDLCDLFADYCDYLTLSGYIERATASWQAMIEYNFFSPPQMQPKFSGNLLDDPMLISFQHFWQNSKSLFGHPCAKGWSEFMSMYSSMTSDPLVNRLESQLMEHVSNVESALLNSNNDEVGMWLKLEEARQEAFWLPDTTSDSNEQEDPERAIPFQLVQPVLITLHNPQNISGAIPPSVVAQNAKKKLLLLYLNSLGVSNAPVSIQHDISTPRVRWQQLEQIYPADKLLRNSSKLPTKLYADSFIQCSIQQLRNALPSEPNWKEILALLELSFIVKSNLSADSWKQALAAIKSNAKAIMAVNTSNTSLWISYADLLLSLVNHNLFSTSEKARTVLIKEVSKVVEPLEQQVKSMSLPLNQKLHVFMLSLDLISKKSAREFNQSILTHVMETLHRVAFIFSALHSLPPPVDRSVCSFVRTFTEIVSIISSSDESLTQHWNQALHFLIVSRLISMDSEKFREWVIDDCLLTICSIGSSCVWSQEYLYQLSQFLESSLSFIGWFYRTQGRNDGSFLRSILTPIIHKLLQIQTNIKKPILEAVISPKIVQSSIGNSELSDGQRFKLRNFLWSLLSSLETETFTKFNLNCQSSTILLLSLEINRLNKLIFSDIGQNLEVFSGRTDRVRSTFTRLINLRCMHWSYRLVMWHSYMQLESEQNIPKRDENTKGVFYRAITELPSQKSLYLSIIALVPSMLEEATMLMKNNRVRMFTPVEEIKLLIRIRQSKASITSVEDF